MKWLIWRCFWFENISVFLNREIILIYWPAKTQHAAHQNSENVCCIPLLHVILDNISAFLTFSLHEKWLNTQLFLVHIFPHSDRIRRDSLSLRIQSECGKIRTRKSSIFGHFSRSVLNNLFPSLHKKYILLELWFHLMVCFLKTFFEFFLWEPAKYIRWLDILHLVSWRSE